jgi:DNA polymerase-3 subunit delta
MIYIFHGPDNFTRNERVAELRASFSDPALASLNTITLEGQTVTLSGIRHHSDAMPFMAERRLVIVKGYLARLKNKEELAQLVDYLSHVPPTTDLVLVEHDKLDKRHPLLKLDGTFGVKVVLFSGPDARNLRAWIIDRAQQRESEIESTAAEQLGRLVGVELRTLDNEIEKLILYTAGKRPIKADDVTLLVPYVEESENFGLANAIGQRNTRKAYDQLHKMVDEGQHPMAILARIATQIRGLLAVKDMAERGMSPAEIARLKGWRSDYAAKVRLREASSFSMARLEEILETLLSIDLDIKTGRIESDLALDTLVAILCTGH